MRLKTFVPLFFMLLLNGVLNAQTNEPTIATCDGDQSICIDAPFFELCVIIDSSGFNQPIDYFEIDWGDGTSTIVQTTDPSTQYHTYDLTDFFCTPIYDEEKTVKLKTFVVNGPTVSTATFPTFINPPKAFIASNGPICVGENIELDNNSFPTQGLSSCPWDYGDGMTGTSDTHLYADPGQYTIELKVFNMCGTATSTHQIEVLELPVSEPIATGGVAQFLQDTLIVCLGDTIHLNGDSISRNETSWSWKFKSISNNCFDWFPTPTPPSSNVSILERPKLVFYCDGVYSLDLTVNNACNEPDTKTLVFWVKRPPAIHFDLNVSNCTPTIALNPADFLTINEGEPLTCHWDFGPLGTSDLCDPGEIIFDQSTTILFEGSNECGTATGTGQVSITQSGQAIISTTCPDSLCSYDAPCDLSASIIGGNWEINGLPAGPSFDPSAAMPGWNTITYGAEPCILMDEIMIYVENATVSIDGKKEHCIDDLPTFFTGMPTGGTFTGPGITNAQTGEFDPAQAGEGDHTITYTLSAANSFCPGFAEMQVHVDSLTVGFVVISCDGLEVCFELTSETSDFMSILWYFGDSNCDCKCDCPAN